MPKLFKDKCGVCKKPVSYVGWLMDEIFDENHPLEKEATAVLCDFADSSGCFGNYHKECFKKHTCAAYNNSGKKK